MLAGVWLIYCCFGLTMAAMAPLVQPISQDLALSRSAMGSILGIWPLVYIGAAMPAGSLLDRFGLRRSLFVAALVIALSGALRAAAPGYAGLAFAVAVFGLGGPLVSTSANLAGHRPQRTALGVRRQFGNKLDYILTGRTDPAAKPSTIRDAITNKVIRAG